MVDPESPLIQAFLQHIDVFYRSLGTHWYENGFHLAETVQKLNEGDLAGMVTVQPDMQVELMLFK